MACAKRSQARQAWTASRIAGSDGLGGKNAVAGGNEGTATLVFRRDANFPASDQQQQLTLFIRATKPGEDPLAGISSRRLVAVPFEG